MYTVTIRLIFILCAWSATNASAQVEAIRAIQELTENLKELSTQSDKAFAEQEGPPVQPHVNATTLAILRKGGEDQLNEILRKASSSALAIYGPLAIYSPEGRMNVALPCSDKAIYGCADDRRNYGDPDVTEHQRMAARATAALVSASKLSSTDGGQTFSMPSKNEIRNGIGLCTREQSIELGLRHEERFFDEANPAFCSAFKVGADLLATAAHCIRSERDCADTRIVFGFHKSSSRPNPEVGIPKNDIYRCIGIVGGEKDDSTGSDWLVIRVDRTVPAPEVKIRTSNFPKIQVDESLTVVGYPMGLPVKIAGNARVRQVREAFFVANLDTYGGNSGSAVFNSEKLSKGELFVEGILVRGEVDFHYTEKCFASKWCPMEGCRGEDVTLASELEGALNARANLAQKDQ